MKAKTKSKREPSDTKNHQNSSEVSSPKPTPFELVQTAIALCGLSKKDPQFFSPKDFFAEAHVLLAKAKDYLREDWKANLGQFWSSYLDTVESFRDANLPIPFHCLLREVRITSAGKKSRTYVGTINTQNGLEKAIRRYFPREIAARLIRAQAMTSTEHQQLLRSQKMAVQKRSSKRVKGANNEKN
jgi:hypothetical protein